MILKVNVHFEKTKTLRNWINSLCDFIDTYDGDDTVEIEISLTRKDNKK